MTNSRKIVAALACRAKSTRLYAKPLQNLSEHITILDFLIKSLKSHSKYIDDICLGIAEGIENDVFESVAKINELPFIRGDEKDVLKRLIMCGEETNATDIFRVTTECPFIAFEFLSHVHENHIKNNNDVTVLDGVPHGMHFEIYTLDALKRSHANGSNDEKSEYCSLHIRNNLEKFKVEVITPEKKFMRPDIRVTVDYPEDLILARNLFYAFEEKILENFNLKNLIAFIDKHKDLKSINAKYSSHKFFWL